MDNAQTHNSAGSAPPVKSNLSVVDVLQRAEQELRHLSKERVEISKRIGVVKRTILGLAKLFGDGVLDTIPLEIFACTKGSRRPGITRACRRVLMEAELPMSAPDVCDEIQRTAASLLAHHKDPLATINTILGRLVQYGEARVSPGKHGRRTWAWVAEQNDRPEQKSEQYDPNSMS